MTPPASTPPVSASHEIHDLTALQLAAALRSGELGAREVTEHTLRRAAELGPQVGAFVHLAEERALADAARAEDLLSRHRRGQVDAADLPPLLGVPVPVKDLDPVAGEPYEAGSAAYRGNVAQADGGMALALREAGTVMLGKTTTPEFGMPAYTEPDIAAPARTPWDLTRSAGGSSGGAGAAVAARIVPAAQASDGGGSIRIPAAACGLVGLKASRGLISPGPDGTAGFGLATGGALTRDVRDTAALLDVLSRPWPGDASRPTPPDGGHLAALDRAIAAGPTDAPALRIGVLCAPVVVDDAPVHPEALAAVDRAAEHLVAMGHELVDAPRPFGQADWEVFMPIWAIGALSVPVPPESEHQLVPLTRWLRDVGREVAGLQLAEAYTGMQRLERQVARTWEGLDVVLTPMLAGPPATIGALRDDADPAADFFAQRAYTPWGSLANITGSPAISLPLHRAEVDGVTLPFGVMLTAPHGQDARLLALAAQLEAADPWPGAPLGWAS